MSNKIKPKERLIRGIYLFTEAQLEEMKKLRDKTGHSVCELMRMAADKLIEENK